MKGCLQIVLAVVLHPVALVLMWINLAGRSDLTGAQKLLWALIGVLWGIGPLLYVLFGGGSFW